ncbi:hypothetical protein [Chelativorans xinjiangense]|uniref:hypothetical protein n=1 Tax=Chelativorans xinjiangense TaxID=2681485 RepID=UPI003CCCCDD9
MSGPFQLAACAEMLCRDQPIEWHAARLTEMGLGVGLWNWTDHDLSKLGRSGASFTIRNGHKRLAIACPLYRNQFQPR